MREIEFRAWVDYGNGCGEMLPNVQNHISGDWAFGNMLMNNVRGCDFKIMQYTGLKDCAGAKIFEGDVLEFDWRYQDSGELYTDDCESIKGVISWCYGKFVCRYFNNALSFDAGDINQATFERFWRDTFNGDSKFYKMTGFKVIGNIHEAQP